MVKRFRQYCMEGPQRLKEWKETRQRIIEQVIDPHIIYKGNINRHTTGQMLKKIHDKAYFLLWM